jgi:hypothetical protein
MSKYDEIDDEEMTDSLFRLRAILLAKESELETIAQRCSTLEEFIEVVHRFFQKDDVVMIRKEELVIIWKQQELK